MDNFLCPEDFWSVTFFEYIILLVRGSYALFVVNNVSKLLQGPRSLSIEI
jgi:hypothetical protein